VAIDFKGVHFPKAGILLAVFFHVRYAVPAATLKRSWPSVASQSTTPRRTAGWSNFAVDRGQFASPKALDSRFLAHGRNVYQG